MRHLASIILVCGLTACGHPSAPSSTVSSDHLRVADAADESGDAALAASIYAKALAAEPNDTSLRVRYADMLVRHNQTSQAGDVLLQGIKSGDARPLHGPLGLILILQGDPAKAITEFDSAGGSDPRWAVDKAVALDMLGRHDEAQALYRGALTASPTDLVVLNDLAMSLLLSGQRAEASKVETSLEGRTDLSPRIASGFGIVLASNGDLDGAHRVIGAAMSDDQLHQITAAVH